MKSRIKKVFAMLAASVLLTSSAAAYAAQTPSNEISPAALSTINSYAELKGDLTLRLVNLSTTGLSGYLDFYIWGANNIHSRLTYYHINVQKEEGIGTGIYNTVYDDIIIKDLGQSLYFDLDFDYYPNENVIITAEATAEVYQGSTYLGTVKDSCSDKFMMWN